ncbi:MAG: hypothetical protein N3E40_00215 [Dehalococcoidia bacterium]|nr:hypothetical protein [Dehalococcoidia bacterium]
MNRTETLSLVYNMLDDVYILLQDTISEVLKIFPDMDCGDLKDHLLDVRDEVVELITRASDLVESMMDEVEDSIVDSEGEESEEEEVENEEDD